MATSMNCTQAIWMRHASEGFEENMTESMVIYCDNASAISISNNVVLYARTKHIELKYHYLRERVQEKKIRMDYV